MTCCFVLFCFKEMKKANAAGSETLTGRGGEGEGRRNRTPAPEGRCNNSGFHSQRREPLDGFRPNCDVIWFT